jgi:hypothetical protein
LGGIGNILFSYVDHYDGTIYMGNQQFLNSAYDAGAAHCFTGLAVHPYTSNIEPPDGPDNAFFAALADVRKSEAAHGDSGRPLWITEFGYYTGCGTQWRGCEPASWPAQANFLECAYQLVAGMPDIKALMVIGVYDSADGSPPTQTEFWGVYQDPNTPKPAVPMFTKLFGTFGDHVPRISRCSQIYNWQQ